jgi:hypothetical protein
MSQHKRSSIAAHYDKIQNERVRNRVEQEITESIAFDVSIIGLSPSLCTDTAESVVIIVVGTYDGGLPNCQINF